MWPFKKREPAFEFAAQIEDTWQFRAEGDYKKCVTLFEDFINVHINHYTDAGEPRARHPVGFSLPPADVDDVTGDVEHAPDTDEFDEDCD